jgi:hypothetical protein
MNILIVTCEAELLQGLQPQAPDDVALLCALQYRGVQVRAVAWDDPTVQWDQADLIVIRSTWDYHHRIQEFLAWAGRVSRCGRLLNPLRAVLWNAHKSYLRDLAAQGIPTIPTQWIAQGSHPHLTAIMARCEWERIMLKPAVGAGGHAALAVDSGNMVARGQTHLEYLLQSQDVLIQPLLPQTEEQSIFWVNGQWSIQSVSKLTTATIRATSTRGNESVREARSDELCFAQMALKATCTSIGVGAEELLYARIDVVHDRGTLRLMEIELIEPQLYFRCLPDLTERFVNALLLRAGELIPSGVSSGAPAREGLLHSGYRQG